MSLMYGYIRRHWRMFLTALFFLTMETLADLLQPALMSYIVDDGVKLQDTGRILFYGAVMLGIAALGALGAVMRNIYASRTSQLIGKELRLDIYKKVQTLSFENIDRLQAASIITRITNDVTQIQNFINGIMRIMLKAPVTCIGAVVLIVAQTPAQFPVMAAILAIASLLIVGNMKLGYPRFGILQGKLDKLNQVSREFLSAIRVVKAFRAEEREGERFLEASEEFAGAGVSAMRVMAVFAPLINLTVNMGIIVLLWASGSRNSGEIGKLMASVNYMTQILFSLGMASNILNSAVRAIASSERVEEIFKEEPAQRQAVLPDAMYNKKGSIAFEKVSFLYKDASRPALEDITFCAEAGETIGIIGPTGSGKSTLTELVPRFYDAAKGRVLVGGQDVTRMDMRRLREGIAVVPQKALLFSGTIAENLRWGDQAASDEEVRAACETACADDFVSGFPEGYQTQLGQGGVNLSGGQKQRLSIARALLRKPDILILDDCTSALDASTESRVLHGLKEKAQGMTVLLISQRIATVMRADRILCLEDGRVKGYGTHQELMEGCAVYQAIYESQIGRKE